MPLIFLRIGCGGLSGTPRPSRSPEALPGNTTGNCNAAALSAATLPRQPLHRLLNNGTGWPSPGAGHPLGVRRPVSWLSWSPHDPGHRTTRRPVPAEDWNRMNPDMNSHPGASGSDPAVGRPARLAVGIVGAGRAGTALGVALARAGHPVVAVSAVSDASLRRAHANFPGAVITDPGQVIGHADLALLTVPDDALPGLIAGLAATGAPLEGRMLAHASGRYGVTVLEEAVRQGALPLALHPVMTSPAAATTSTGSGEPVSA